MRKKLMVWAIIITTWIIIAPSGNRLGIISNADADYVKRSNTDICHEADVSQYYDRIKHYEVFETLEDCLFPDGRLSKRDHTIPKYNRKFFGNAWGDVDGDGINTRHEILIDQSTAPVRFKNDNNTLVLNGRWISMFTNDIITNASDLDIDHIVSLKWAWVHGASKWTYEKRKEFANDPINLIPVEASLNRSKSWRGPDMWLPPENRCMYMIRFIRVYKTYGLKLSPNEQEDFDFIRSSICD